jgi:catechol 2,3-dioxygenase-like lactoylglutathione lyase family enzyme
VVYSRRGNGNELALHDEDTAMESLIDGWLKDFEAGAMTRRELIERLLRAAAIAAAAPSVSALTLQTIPPPAGPPPWKTVWLDHISYGVSDYRKSAAFYRDLMGWEIQHDNRQHQCSMKIGNIGGVIIRNRRQAAGDGAQPARGSLRGLTGVIDHVSWGIEPWETNGVKAELERRGLKPRADMVGANFKSFHVKDPDGWDLQISNQRDASELGTLTP